MGLPLCLPVRTNHQLSIICLSQRTVPLDFRGACRTPRYAYGPADKHWSFARNGKVKKVKHGKRCRAEGHWTGCLGIH